MASINATTMSATIKALYERRLLARAFPRLIHGRWGTIATLSQYGSYELRRYESLGLISTTLTEGGTPDEQSAPSITTVTMSPAWYGAWVSYTDKLQMQAYDPVISQISGILGEQAGLSIDTLLRNDMVSGSTRLGGATGLVAQGSIAASTDKFTYAMFVRAVAKLETNNALPVEGDKFVCVMHPMTWACAMQDATFVGLFQKATGDDTIRTGYIGSILRCNLYVSSNSKIFTGAGASSADVYSTLFIGRDAYGMIGMSGLVPDYVSDGGGGEYANLTDQTAGASIKPVDLIIKDLGETGLDPLNQRGTVGWKATHSDAILNSTWIINQEHTVS